MKCIICECKSEEILCYECEIKSYGKELRKE